MQMCTRVHATCDKMHILPSYRKWGDGASDQQYVKQIREEAVSNERRQCRQREDGVWRQRTAVNNTARI